MFAVSLVLCDTPANVAIDNYEKGISDYERENSAQRRRANLEMKFSNRTDNPVIGTANPIAELQTIQAAQVFGAASQKAHGTAVHFECRLSDAPKQINQMLGTGIIFFPEVNTMLGTSRLVIPTFHSLRRALALRSRIVKEVNGRWTEFYSAPLLECVFLIHAFEPVTDTSVKYLGKRPVYAPRTTMSSPLTVSS